MGGSQPKGLGGDRGGGVMNIKRASPPLEKLNKSSSVFEERDLWRQARQNPLILQVKVKHQGGDRKHWRRGIKFGNLFLRAR